MPHSFPRANKLDGSLRERERRETKRLVRTVMCPDAQLKALYRRYDRLRDAAWDRYGP